MRWAIWSHKETRRQGDKETRRQGDQEHVRGRDSRTWLWSWRVFWQVRLARRAFGRMGQFGGVGASQGNKRGCGWRGGRDRDLVEWVRIGGLGLTVLISKGCGDFCRPGGPIQPYPIGWQGAVAGQELRAILTNSTGSGEGGIRTRGEV